MEDLVQLYKETYNTRVKKLTFTLNGDKAGAEDVVQEAFTRALKFYNSYDNGCGDINAWFNKILFNCLRDYQREKLGYGIVRNNIEEEDEEATMWIKIYPIDAKIRALINEQLESYTNLRHKRILQLFFILGYTTAQIPQIELGVSQTNVTTIIKRFKDSIKEKGLDVSAI